MMSRAIILILLSAVCNASRDDEKNRKGDTHVDVKARSFSQIHEEAQPMAQKQETQADAKIEQLRKERDAVLTHAADLERQMTEHYASMIGQKVENVASLLQQQQTGDDKMTEDEQFAQLEAQTNQMTSWFKELKQLRTDRDVVIAKNKHAARSAKLMAHSQNQAKAATSDQQREHLQSIMASSAIEMAQIKTASDDVLSAIDSLTEWKKRDDNSHESHAQAVKVKSKLARAMNFLKEHEDTINVRSQQINTLMKEAGMGPLGGVAA